MPLVPVNAGGVAKTSPAELTGEVRDMQNLYELFALGLTRGLTLSRENLQREEGQGAVEYALVVLGIAVVVAAAVAGFATQISNFMSAAGTALIALAP
jgi:Flp pilus assembly pilin Flp